MKRLFINTALLLFTAYTLPHPPLYACTIASGVDRNGHVWNANNEDGPVGVANFLNVFPRQENTKYGYYTLCYVSPMFGDGGQIQGGMNEAGLTFDFAAIEPVNKTELKNKKPFPKGDNAILTHLLGTMRSTQEVVNFSQTYWFENGFLSAKMHVADKNGVFANISPSGIQLVDKGERLVTTNFDICGKEDKSSCWRYPIASSLLLEQGASLSTMMSLCRNTAQKTGGTMYSTIQNLTTGDIWFFSKHDPDNIVNTTIQKLLTKGQASYTLSDLRSLTSEREPQEWAEPTAIPLDKTAIDPFAGTYQNWYIGEIEVTSQDNQIRMTSPFAPAENLYAQSENRFFIPDAKIAIAFEVDKKENKKTMHFFENGRWSFSA